METQERLSRFGHEAEPKQLLIAFGGESGSGKTTVIDTLSTNYEGFKKLISYTTRSPRAGEKNGEDYYFVDESFFEENSENFLQTYRSSDGYLYGVLEEDCGAADSIPISTMVPSGVHSFLENNYQVLYVYIEVSEETKIQRMKDRGDSDEEIKIRLERDRKMRNEVENLRKQNVSGLDHIILTEDTAPGERAKKIYEWCLGR